MFISNFVRSKFVSRLRPWLVEEPELELELGFLVSRGCAKNLAFDPSALNSLIEDSTGLEFKRVEVGELHVRVSPWFSPSIKVEVRGLHATLTHRTPTKLQDVHRDLAARKKKEMIASLDSEGASLHDAIEGLLDRDISGDRPITLWADIIASSFHLKFQDICLELQLPGKSHACLLEIDEICSSSHCLYSTSLLRKFFDSFFVHGKSSELSISCSNMKFGLKENGQKKWIASLMGTSFHVKLIGFHPLGNSILIPTTVIKLSPEVIPQVLLILDAFSSKGHGIARTGKELWKIAANRISHSTLGARHPLQNVIEMVVFWSHYVYAYGSLLDVVGSLHDVSIRENVGKPFIHRKLIIRAKHQLGLIFHLEEKLPAHMVVQARRIARYKRFLIPTNLKEPMGFFSKLLRKILAPLWLLWGVICFIFQAALPRTMDGSTKHGGARSFCFSFEEVFITLSHSNCVHFPITKAAIREDKMNLPSFYLSLRQLYLIYKTDGTKLSFFAALEGIKLCLAASLQIPLDHNLIMKRSHSSKAVHPEGIDELNVIFWGEPASLYHCPQVVCNDDSLKPFGIILENDIRGLWSTWSKIRGKHEENALHEGGAFLLCELKYFLADHRACGLWKYSLNIGKMSLDLDYSSILSAVLMFRQLENYSQWTTRAGIKPTIPRTSNIIVDKPGTSEENAVGLFAKKIAGAIFNMIPDKNIHVGAVFAGLGIRISLEERALSYIEKDIIPVISQGNSRYWFQIDIGNTEFVAWPASTALLSAMTAEAIFEETPSEYLWLKEPQIFYTHQEETADDKFFSHGRITLNACLRSNLVNVSSGSGSIRNLHIVDSISITTKASICRFYQRGHCSHVHDCKRAAMLSYFLSPALPRAEEVERGFQRIHASRAAEKELLECGWKADDLVFGFERSLITTTWIFEG